jgi:prepilin-type processing-associated H-X9-DG protein
LAYLEQANKYNQFVFAFDVTSATNAPARRQDVPTFLCPSERSVAFFLDGGQPVGRTNYFGSIGAVADCRLRDDPKGGIFVGDYSNVVAGQVPRGIAMTEITDGTSNTAMFSEVMRSQTANSTTVDYTTCVTSGTISTAPGVYDGRTVSGCAGGTVVRLINYVGLQYYRGGINHQSFYTHTLPINWNAKQVLATDQKYSCGDSSFRRAHISASSYHQGGVNVCLADGSVRFVRDSIDFTIWQNVGSRAGGEVPAGLD